MKVGKKTLFLVRLLVVVAAYAFVFLSVYRQGGSNFSDAFAQVSPSKSWLIFAMAILLMPLSWVIEALKWNWAIRGFAPESLARSFKSVWYGVGVGLLTPNRVGEPFGRMAMVNPDVRANAGVMAVLCAVSQQMVTICFGLFGLFILTKKYSDNLNYLLGNSWVLVLLGLSVLVVLLLLVRMKFISKHILKLSAISRLLAHDDVEIDISSNLVIKLLLASIIRYSLFTSQFYLMLNFFGIDANSIEIYAAIFSAYLFASVVPSFALGEGGVRASFAVTFLGVLWYNPLSIASAALLLWMVNVALPGLIGVWFPVVKNNE